jgi:hypothetical protein
MKLLLIMTVVISSVVAVTICPTVSSAEPAPNTPEATSEYEYDPAQPQSEPLEPYTPATQLESLSVTEPDLSESASEQDRRLDNQAQRINRNLDARQPNSTQLRDLLDLPEGMIIRGSSRGGIGIGAEY